MNKSQPPQPNVPEPVLQTVNLPEERRYYAVYSLYFASAGVVNLELDFDPDTIICYLRYLFGDGDAVLAFGYHTLSDFTQKPINSWLNLPHNGYPITIPGFSRYLSVYATYNGVWVMLVAYKGYK